MRKIVEEEDEDLIKEDENLLKGLCEWQKIAVIFHLLYKEILFFANVFDKKVLKEVFR